jgi:hypothetical protein
VYFGESPPVTAEGARLFWLYALGRFADTAELTLGDVSWMEEKCQSECRVDRAGNGEVVLAEVSKSAPS